MKKTAKKVASKPKEVVPEIMPPVGPLKLHLVVQPMPKLTVVLPMAMVGEVEGMKATKEGSLRDYIGSMLESPVPKPLHEREMVPREETLSRRAPEAKRLPPVCI